MGAQMLSDNEFRKLLEFFNRPWAGYRKVRKGVKKRVRRHMIELGCPTIDAYLKALAVEPELRAVCEQHLNVTISRFFRDRQLWKHIETNVLPDLIRRFDGTIRVWSAGCANGEEPYSLSILWVSLKIDRALEIVATDADASVLERARLGTYPQSSLKELPNDLKHQFFDRRRGRFMIRAHCLPSIQWRRRNLFQTPPPGPYHLIFLRNNLLTYYQGAAMQKAFETIMDSLMPDGFLVVGSHEHLPPVKVGLQRNDACRWLYKKVI